MDDTAERLSIEGLATGTLTPAITDLFPPGAHRVSRYRQRPWYDIYDAEASEYPDALAGNH